MRIIFSRKMKIAAVVLVFFCFIVGIGIYLYSQGQLKLPTAIELLISPNSGATEVFSKKFVILPSGYEITQTDKDKIISDKAELILVRNGSGYDKKKIVDKLGIGNTVGIEILPLNETTPIKICGLTKNSNVSSERAAFVDLLDYDLIHGDCSTGQKITKVTEISCKEGVVKCQNEFLGLLHSDNVYVYYAKSPLTTTFPQLTLKTEQKSGMIVALWDNVKYPYNLVQKAYSLEYIDSEGKRFGATGKIERSNQGDSYLPPRDLAGMTVTVKLRVWYQIAGEDLLEPEMYSTTFEYAKNITPEAKIDAVTPVESAWIPEWGIPDGIATLQRNPKKWSTISPTWYYVNADGTLDYQYSSRNAELTSIIRANGIQLIPTVICFDADILKDILNNHLDVHVNEIVSAVVQNGYDGIDIDYEITYFADKDLLIKFVTDLASRLHEKNKVLSFTALPKIDDREIYSFLPQTHQAQDWQAIGAVVDEFRIMAYDYTGQSSKLAGPMSPLPWNEAIIKYAIEKMPASKIVLSLPIYSHAWPKADMNTAVGVNNDLSLNSETSENTYSWQYDDISAIKLNSVGYQESEDLWYGETHAILKYKNKDLEMYYLSPSQITKRIELAKAYGIKGLCYWRIGGDQL